MRVNLAMSLFGLLAATMLATSPAFGHHGWSGYDKRKPLTLAGTTTEVSYTYPHATIKLEVSGKAYELR